MYNLNEYYLNFIFIDFMINYWCVTIGIILYN